MLRRHFMKNAVLGVPAFSALSPGSIRALEGMASPDAASGRLSGGWDDGLGRPVRITSIGFKPHAHTGYAPPQLAEIVEHVDQQGSRSCDVILLPEACRGQTKTSQESLSGQTVKAMAALAKKHKTYILVPIDRESGTSRLNSAVLLDRSGQVVAVYDKIFPYWAEYDLRPPVTPGDSVKVYNADFGTIGIATCFDVNFPEVWRRLDDLDADIVLWPSAYSGGNPLQAHATNHHYYIVSSTGEPDCTIYDITGKCLKYESSERVNITHVTLDLDRGLYHQNFNLDRRDALLRDHPHDVVQEEHFDREQWFVLRAKRPGVSARMLARQYGLEELRHYVQRSRSQIDKRRGWAFEESIYATNTVKRPGEM